MEKLIRKIDKEIMECAKAQSDYQDKNHQPDFAPHSGICWNCHENIYQNIGYKKDPDSIWSMGIKCTIDGEMVDHVYGISLEKASTQLITGCPHCNRSYCD
jgi:hypothetical protein